MKKIKLSIERILPPLVFKKLADRIFLIALLCIILGSSLFSLNEGFVSAIAALAIYLGSMGIKDRSHLVLRTIYTTFFSLLSILLGALAPMELLFTVPIYTFFLVFLEQEEYHRGIPTFFLPLSVLFLSLEIPMILIPGRGVSVLIGVLVALVAHTFIWPSKTKNEIPKKTNRSSSMSPPSFREIYINFKFNNNFNSLKLMYSLRKSLGLSLIFLIGFFLGRDIAAGGAFLFLILHSSIDDIILPKSVRRLKGTILGGLIYIPLGYFIESKPLIFVLAMLALYIGFLFLQHCYSTAVTFLTLNFLLFSVGHASFEKVITLRLLFVFLGGGVALIMSLLIPLKGERVTQNL